MIEKMQLENLIKEFEKCFIFSLQKAKMAKGTRRFVTDYVKTKLEN